MGKFLSKRFSNFEAYVPGEQPRDRKYIKLNTNESPYEPISGPEYSMKHVLEKLNLYCDPTQEKLRETAALYLRVSPENILPVNGSDEILNYAFMAFCGKEEPIAFPQISYGFYPVLAGLYGIPAQEIPLKDDFSIDYRDYIDIKKNIVIANPNAPTGIALPPEEIEDIVASNPNHVVIIDEAYVDFGAKSVIPLTKKYRNLLVTRTFSKSHSLAGARLGFGIADEELIADMNIIKYSTNPYNVNSVTAALGITAFENDLHYKENWRQIIETREHTARELRKLGFSVTDSKANFLFAKSDRLDGKTLYLKLRENGILVRHFDKESICDYLRITVGTEYQMNKFIETVTKILDERGGRIL